MEGFYSPRSVFYDCSRVMPSLFPLPHQRQVNGIADLQAMVRIAQDIYIPSNE